jgi:hypothetical protein
MSGRKPLFFLASHLSQTNVQKMPRASFSSRRGRPEPHGQVFMALSPFCYLDGTPMRGRNIGGAIKGEHGWWRVEGIDLLTGDAVHAHIGHGIVHSVFADGAFAVPARNAVVSCEFCFHEFCSISSGAMTPIVCGAAHGHARQPDAWTRQCAAERQFRIRRTCAAESANYQLIKPSTPANVDSENLQVSAESSISWQVSSHRLHSAP